MSYHSGHNMVDAHALFAHAGLQPGMHVADFGCGRTGHLVFPAAKHIGEKGMLYAVDILKDVLENIKKRAAMDGFTHIHPIWSNLEIPNHTAIQDSSVDVAFLVNTLSQCDNRHAVLDEARRMLKPKSRLVIVDWGRKGLPFGPADERFLNFSDIIRWSTMHGFALQKQFAMGPYHQGLVLYRNH